MRRRVGDVRVGDTGVVALVCDHSTAAFKQYLFPMLQARGLTCTLSLNANRDQPDYQHTDTEGDVTWEEIKDWADAGIEIANHSLDHFGGVGDAAAYQQIVVGRELLEDKIGRPVDSWVAPGSLHQGDFDGFGSGGPSPSVWWETTAGKLILQSHAVATGVVEGSRHYPVDGEIPIGMAGYWVSSPTSLSNAITEVDNAIASKSRTLLRTHPWEIGTTISTSNFEILLDHLKSKQDEGSLRVVTLREWAIAQK